MREDDLTYIKVTHFIDTFFPTSPSYNMIQNSQIDSRRGLKKEKDT